MTQINPEVLPPFVVEPDPLTPEQNLANLRMIRDRLLAASDWMAVQDRTMTQEEIDYRQALRDITEHYDNLDDAVFPVLGGSNAE
jgi:hypothetical protein